MALIDSLYADLATNILNYGFKYMDTSRNNVGMLQIPHYLLDIPIGSQFPLLTTKHIHWKNIAHELIWMLSGSENIEYLINNKVHIWDKDADGLLVGRIYGPQWRAWSYTEHSLLKRPIDQIHKLLINLKYETFNRRHIVTAWQPAELNAMVLPPCHWAFEIIPYLHISNICFILKWHQRSVDTFLGLPYDIASYAFLGHIIEKLTSFKFTRLIGDLSNVHFYEPHLKAVEIQLNNSTVKVGPWVYFQPFETINDLTIDHFNIVGYNPFPTIKADLIPKAKKVDL